jgi:hypothetical protein
VSTRVVWRNPNFARIEQNPNFARIEHPGIVGVATVLFYADACPTPEVTFGLYARSTGGISMGLTGDVPRKP